MVFVIVGVSALLWHSVTAWHTFSNLSADTQRWYVGQTLDTTPLDLKILLNYAHNSSSITNSYAWLFKIHVSLRFSTTPIILLTLPEFFVYSVRVFDYLDGIIRAKHVYVLAADFVCWLCALCLYILLNTYTYTIYCIFIKI